MESGHHCGCRWTLRDSVCDADFYGDVDRNSGPISDTVLYAGDYPVIDSDDYDR